MDLEPSLTTSRRAALALVVGLAGCAAVPSSSPDGSPGATRDALPAELRRLVDAPPGLDFALLGEVHDNPEHHRRRLAWLEALAAGGRFALALEQLDADRQAALDAARASNADARAVALAGGFDADGWPWDTYVAYVELALRRGLPLIAANLSNAETRRIARGASNVPPDPPGWGDVERRTMRNEIRDGHCGLLPERAIAPMAAAQQARDARMARALIDARRRTGLPVVLIAGNGHVRRDIGVPRHLAAAMPQARVYTVGFLERIDATPADEGSARFDRTVPTQPHPRPDPCAQLERLGGRRTD